MKDLAQFMGIQVVTDDDPINVGLPLSVWTLEVYGERWRIPCVALSPMRARINLSKMWPTCGGYG